RSRMPRPSGIGHSRRPTRTDGLPAVSIRTPSPVMETLVSGAPAGFCQPRSTLLPNGGRLLTGRRRAWLSKRGFGRGIPPVPMAATIAVKFSWPASVKQGAVEAGKERGRRGTERVELDPYGGVAWGHRGCHRAWHRGS